VNEAVSSEQRSNQQHKTANRQDRPIKAAAIGPMAIRQVRHRRIVDEKGRKGRNRSTIGGRQKAWAAMRP
jgi:hypothetical protein